MGDVRFERSTLPTLVCLAATFLAVVVFGFSIFSSFRLSDIGIQMAWELNFDRTVLAFSAGLALAASMATSGVQVSLAKHVSAYAFVVLFATGGLLVAGFSLPLYLSIFIAVVFGATGLYVSQKSIETFAKSNLALGLLLYSIFFVSIISYLAAVVFADGFGGVVLWLFSDISHASANGYWVLLAVSLLSIWLIFTSQRELPLLLLFGLSVGLLGPIMFVGYIVPVIVKRLALNTRQHILVSGLVGGSVLVLVSTFNTLILGGYAPALIVPLVFIGIPSVLWLRRNKQKGVVLSFLETLPILAIVLFSIALIWHLGGFAHRLA